MADTLPRHIPAISALLQQPAILERITRDGHDAVVTALRAAADRWRAAPVPGTDAHTWIIEQSLRALESDAQYSLKPVINATGVILHTNLGRAPLAASAMARADEVSRGYSNLEYSLAEGGRGHRHVHAEHLLCVLTGAEAALVTNNNAAATMLVLAALAAGREVLVSRGELVEIGGGFRVPDIMAQSGAVLREVGTTNRTRLSDYGAAMSDRTALVLRVHPSNFRMSGFTERPAAAELTALGKRFNLPVFEDLGSGWLGLPQTAGWPDAVKDEPSVRDAIQAGIDHIAFSGDKLLGGPQAGIVVGRRELVDRVRRHPLMRAVRAGKQTYAALEATLSLWQREPARTEIPVVRMLLAPVTDIDRRAKALVQKMSLVVDIIDGYSTIGGGSAPESSLPTRLIAIRSSGRTASDIEAALRGGSPPVVARIQQDKVLLDLRTVEPGEDDALAEAIGRALAAQA
jgi:L-seryl-tRNA(Ser) seleniumtransferase